MLTVCVLLCSFFKLKNQNRDSQSLLSVTMKQINTASVSNDDKINVLIDGTDVSTVINSSSDFPFHVWSVLVGGKCFILLSVFRYR